jgi:hypothetical protein
VTEPYVAGPAMRYPEGDPTSPAGLEATPFFEIIIPPAEKGETLGNIVSYVEPSGGFLPFGKKPLPRYIGFAYNKDGILCGIRIYDTVLKVGEILG